MAPSFGVSSTVPHLESSEPGSAHRDWPVFGSLDSHRCKRPNGTSDAGGSSEKQSLIEFKTHSQSATHLKNCRAATGQSGLSRNTSKSYYLSTACQNDSGRFSPLSCDACLIGAAEPHQLPVTEMTLCSLFLRGRWLAMASQSQASKELHRLRRFDQGCREHGRDESDDEDCDKFDSRYGLR